MGTIEVTGQHTITVSYGGGSIRITVNSVSQITAQRIQAAIDRRLGEIHRQRIRAVERENYALETTYQTQENDLAATRAAVAGRIAALIGDYNRRNPTPGQPAATPIPTPAPTPPASPAPRTQVTPPAPRVTAPPRPPPPSAPAAPPAPEPEALLPPARPAGGTGGRGSRAESREPPARLPPAPLIRMADIRFISDTLHAATARDPSDATRLPATIFASRNQQQRISAFFANDVTDFAHVGAAGSPAQQRTTAVLFNTLWQFPEFRRYVSESSSDRQRTRLQEYVLGRIPPGLPERGDYPDVAITQAANAVIRDFLYTRAISDPRFGTIYARELSGLVRLTPSPTAAELSAPINPNTLVVASLYLRRAGAEQRHEQDGARLQQWTRPVEVVEQPRAGGRATDRETAEVAPMPGSEEEPEEAEAAAPEPEEEAEEQPGQEATEPESRPGTRQPARRPAPPVRAPVALTQATLDALDQGSWRAVSADAATHPHIGVMGDSITAAGFNDPNRQPSFAAALLQILQDQGQMPDATVMRAGHSGMSARTMAAWVFQEEVLSQAAQLNTIIIEAGVNDVGAARDAARATEAAQAVERSLATMIRDARRQGLRVIVLTITPWHGWGRWTDSAQRATEEVNDWIRSLDQLDGVDVVDIYDTLGEPISQEIGAPHRIIPEYDNGSHLHYSVAGRREMGRQIALQAYQIGADALPLPEASPLEQYASAHWTDPSLSQTLADKVRQCEPQNLVTISRQVPDGYSGTLEDALAEVGRDDVALAFETVFNDILQNTTSVLGRRFRVFCERNPQYGIQTTTTLSPLSTDTDRVACIRAVQAFINELARSGAGGAAVPNLQEDLNVLYQQVLHDAGRTSLQLADITDPQAHADLRLLMALAVCGWRLQSAHREERPGYWARRIEGVTLPEPQAPAGRTRPGGEDTHRSPVLIRLTPGRPPGSDLTGE